MKTMYASPFYQNISIYSVYHSALKAAHSNTNTNSGNTRALQGVLLDMPVMGSV